MKTTWDFVEKYYPNYTSSKKIAENDDLQKIIDGEINGEAENIYKKLKEQTQSFHNGMLTDDALESELIKEVQNLKAKSDAFIFETSIESFLLTKNK